MMMFPVRSGVFAAGCLTLLAFAGGCQLHDAADATDTAVSDGEAAEGGTRDLPALHVVLAWESRMGGENMERKNYRAKLEACQGSSFPTRPLSAQDEARLGTGEVEIMIDARRQFARQVSWTLGAENDTPQGACQIKLVEHRDQDQIEDPSGMYQAIDSDTRTQDRRTMETVGWKSVGEVQVKGQPCASWENGRQEVCMWSGGTQWGFSETPADVAGCTIDGAGAYLESIPLESKPLQGGNGCVLQLKSFSLGKGLIPSNVAGAEDHD